MIQRPVNLDLAGELLTGLGPGQVCLGDNFEGPSGRLVLLSLDRLDSLHLITLCEASFTEETAPAVSDDLARLVVVLRIYGLDLLFNCLST